MELAPEGPMAIPLWVNGRAYLTVTESFFDVIDAATGEAVRRVPLCGGDEAAAAAAAARAAQPGWQALGEVQRQAHLSALADALAGYTAHFAKLIKQETGKPEAEAVAEVEAAVAALRGAGAADEAGIAAAISAGMSAGVAAVIADAARPLAALAEVAAPLLAAGSTLVVKPSPKAPSAVFALCELSGRAGWPAGVVNLLQGDEAAVEGLCEAADIGRLVYAGDQALGERIGAIAARHGKPFALVG